MNLALIILALTAAVVVHEFGHAIFGQLVGLPIRRIELGAGLVLLRFRLGAAVLVVRPLPLAGIVLHLPSLRPRRVANALFVLGGVLGNLALFAVLAAAAAAFPAASHSLAIVAFVQLAFGAANLVPVKLKSGAVSDGRKLLWTLSGAHARAITALYDRTQRLAWNMIGPVPPPSPATAELLYQYARPDRATEPWARRDAAAVVRRVLPGLSPLGLERAFALAFLVSLELLYGDTDLAAPDLDTWSRQVLDLSPAPSHRIMRAGVLLRLGETDAAQTMLRAQLDRPLIPSDAALCRAYLALAARSAGDATTAQKWTEQAYACIPAGSEATLRPILERVGVPAPAAPEPDCAPRAKWRRRLFA